MRELVFFLEEQSAKECLAGLLPRLLPVDVRLRYVVFQGKQDLERQLPIKLRGWCAPLPKFIVLRDKDGGNCIETKNRLRELCRSAGAENALIRIACHEIESWYLGDLSAVEAALNLKKIASQQSKSKYRDPDKLANASEEMLKLTGRKYRKVGSSREIGKHLDPDPKNNKSYSYGVFVSGISRLLIPD